MKKIIIAFFALLTSVTSFALTPASYPGGENALSSYIKENLKYPAASKENGIEGIVNLSVTVRPDGSVGTIKVMQMIDPDLEQEAIRLVKSMPKWTPASDNGTSVESQVVVSVPFEID